MGNDKQSVASVAEVRTTPGQVLLLNGPPS